MRPVRHVRTYMRRLAAALLVIVAAWAVFGAVPGETAQTRVPVFFLQGEQLARVDRTGTTPLDAVRALIAGPTRAEAVKGFRTYVPAGTRVRSVTVANGIATVDLNEPFASGADPGSLLARLSQLVRTLTGLQGATKVQLLIDGAVVAARFPGVSTSDPVSFGFLQTPNVPVPKPPQLKLPAPDAAVKRLQLRLIELGYLLRGDDDGRFGPATQNAILAFQKWERLRRTGLMDAQTNARLATAKHPAPLTRGVSGKRAEILLDRQVSLVINNNRVVRTIAVSSGKPSTPTPPGDYRVYAKIPRWWSVPFREWLPWALPFVGGIAYHEFPDVPTFPASHGCVRQSTTVARWTYNFATIGMPVKVIARS
jgi:peptidoglycan hydrolase-like protein with peptidoglycan-binding domain